MAYGKTYHSRSLPLWERSHGLETKPAIHRARRLFAERFSHRPTEADGHRRSEPGEQDRSAAVSDESAHRRQPLFANFGRISCLLFANLSLGGRTIGNNHPL